MWHTIAHWFLHYTGADNPSGPWYGFWSGFGSDFGEVTVFGGLGLLLRHHNCHVKGCYRVGHIDPAVGVPACRKHHSLRDLHGSAPN